MTIFISQPMTGRTETDIIEERGRAAEQIKKIYGDNIEICDSYRTDIERDNTEKTRLYHIVKSWASLAFIHFVAEDIGVGQGEAGTSAWNSSIFF